MFAEAAHITSIIYTVMLAIHVPEHVDSQEYYNMLIICINSTSATSGGSVVKKIHMCFAG
jgi:hypothetical protein